MNAKIISKKLIHKNLMILKIRLLEGSMAPFKPGQFGTLGLLEDLQPITDRSDKPLKQRWIRRSYSIASGQSEINHVEYFITQVKSGLLTHRLFHLREGDILWMAKKAAGFFTLDPIPDQTHLIWIATGTGVAPFVSMLRSHILRDRLDYKVVLLHGVRYKNDLGYETELIEMTTKNKNFFYFPIVSRPDPTWQASQKAVGRVQLLWQSKVIEQSLGCQISPQNTHIMLCGNPYMIQDMVAILEKLGFSVHSRRQPGNIHFEKYWNV